MLLRNSVLYFFAMDLPSLPHPPIFHPFSTAPSLRFFDPRDGTIEKKRFSEAVFRFNLLYFNCLTTIFFVGIFLRLVNYCNQVAKLAPKG